MIAVRESLSSSIVSLEAAALGAGLAGPFKRCALVSSPRHANSAASIAQRAPLHEWPHIEMPSGYSCAASSRTYSHYEAS